MHVLGFLSPSSQTPFGVFLPGNKIGQERQQTVSKGKGQKRTLAQRHLLAKREVRVLTADLAGIVSVGKVKTSRG